MGERPIISRNFVENAVVQKGRQKYVFTGIAARYKNYEFFTVETDIKY